MSDPGSKSAPNPEQARALAAFVQLWNDHRFYESHEIVEEVWLRDRGPDRLFMQGLIQLAGALHHVQRGNARSARSLLGLARAKLAPYPPVHWNLDAADLLARVAAFIETDAGRPWSELDPPRIELNS